MFEGNADLVFLAIFALVIIVRLFFTLGKTDFNHDAFRSEQETKDSAEAHLSIEEKDPELKNLKPEVLELESEKFSNQLQEIKKYDPSFSISAFLQGAKQAFDIIIMAFSKGDKKVLKSLLSKDVYRGFQREIDRREKEGVFCNTTIVSILSSDICSIELYRKTAKIKVKFVSEQVNLVKNKDGKIIEGSASDVDTISDSWTFARSLTSSNPNWELIETQEG